MMMTKRKNKRDRNQIPEKGSEDEEGETTKDKM